MKSTEKRKDLKLEDALEVVERKLREKGAQKMDGSPTQSEGPCTWPDACCGAE